MIRGKQFVDVRFEQQDVEGEQFSEDKLQTVRIRKQGF